MGTIKTTYLVLVRISDKSFLEVGNADNGEPFTDLRKARAQFNAEVERGEKARLVRVSRKLLAEVA